MEILLDAIRQYRHNYKCDFVAGYDVKETDRIVSALQDRCISLEKQLHNNQRRIGKGKKMKFEFSLTLKEINNLANLCESTHSPGAMVCIGSVNGNTTVEALSFTEKNRDVWTDCTDRGE